VSASWFVSELSCQRDDCQRVGLSVTWFVSELSCQRIDCQRVGLSASCLVSELTVSELVCQRDVCLPTVYTTVLVLVKSWQRSVLMTPVCPVNMGMNGREYEYAR